MKAVLRVRWLAVVAGVLACASLGRAQQMAAPPMDQSGTPEATEQAPANPVAYLGVGIERLHPAFANQFPNLLAQGQGLLIVNVTPDSPAAKANLRTFDILHSFNDQKLSSPEQLIQLVQAAKPDQEVTLGFIREAKPQTVTTKLGARSAEELAASESMMRHHVMRAPGEMRERRAEELWKDFDSLTLKNLGNNRFRVDLDFRTDQGKTEHRTFEGNRDEIRQALDRDTNLPPAERFHVLRSLDIREGGRPASGF